MFILNKPYLGTLLINLYVIKQTLLRDVVKQTFIHTIFDQKLKKSKKIDKKIQNPESGIRPRTTRNVLNYDVKVN